MAAFVLTDHDAMLFDLDGVLTDTAALHARAWKAMFDEFLLRWSDDHGHPFLPFDIARDYLTFVDGLPRYGGVASFLESRRIVLPEGEPNDPPDADTIHGLGNRKNDLVQKLMEGQGVDPIEGSVRFVDAARAAGVAIAVVSSSRNARTALAAAGIDDRFEVVIDGLVAEQLALAGKPAPDTYLEAARRLDVRPDRAVVVEDAIAGVEAGRLGGFGVVIGVDRGDQAKALERAGANFVVADLRELLAD